MALLSKDYHEAQLKRTLHGNYRPHGDISRADCVIGTGFGYRTHNGASVPSQSTHDIAHFVAAFEHLPKYLDHSLSEAYKSLNPSHHPGRLHSVNGGAHLETTELLRQIRALLISKKHKMALLLGHPNHVAWLDYICGQINIMTVVPKGLEAVRFDPESAQPWTRSLAAWQTEIRRLHDPHNPDAYLEVFWSL